jgi:hypothetical protein
MEESNLHANKRPTLGSSHIPNTTANSNTSSLSSTQKPFTRLPKLTDGKKDLLCAHSGCFKCRKFNADYGSGSPLCTGFPAGAGYKTITKYVDAAGQPAIKGTEVPKPKVEASTIKEVESEDDVIAAFAPSASLENGTDSGGSDNVSDLGLLKCKHFIWNCTINGLLSEFPLKVSALVDNDCHLVLIRPDIIQKLSLPIHTLHTPEPVDVTIKNGKEKQKCILKEFVILGITSIDQQWSSKHIRAIITPNLCMPLILGIPFLSHNNIVTDHALRSCVNKENSYNLINLKIALPLPPKTLPMTKREESKKNRKDYLKKLKEVCSQ